MAFPFRWLYTLEVIGYYCRKAYVRSIKYELKCRSVIAVHGESAFRLFFCL